jgi:ankyrin repeat protein
VSRPSRDASRYRGHERNVPRPELAWVAGDLRLDRVFREEATVPSNEIHRTKVLLDYGADVNHRAHGGLTALYYAARSGKLSLIELLLRRGSDPEIRDDVGRTPLMHLKKSRAKLEVTAVEALLTRFGAG